MNTTTVETNVIICISTLQNQHIAILCVAWLLYTLFIVALVSCYFIRRHRRARMYKRHTNSIFNHSLAAWKSHKEDPSNM